MGITEAHKMLHDVEKVGTKPFFFLLHNTEAGGHPIKEAGKRLRADKRFLFMRLTINSCCLLLQAAMVTT